MRLRLSVIATSVLVVGTPMQPRQAETDQDVAGAVLANFEITEPPLRCDVPTIAGFVAARAGVPIGVEHVPDDCEGSDRRPMPTRRSLAGSTVRQVLDLLVRHDPRYTWSVVDGGVTFRPIAAIGFVDHFLHTTVARFELHDASVDGAFAAVMHMLGIRFPPRP